MGWAEIYRPEELSEIYGNDDARKELKKWAVTWNDHTQAVILYGPPGVGKTSAAYALANDMGWNTIEMNASDKRTRSEIEAVAGEASQSTSLTDSTRRAIIVDEADNLHGNYDRGGSRAITELIKDSSQPVILLANDFYEMSRTLRNNCQDIEFSAVETPEIAKALRDVCEAEGIEYDIKTLRRIADHAKGDVRSAINDLQAIANGHDSIKGEQVMVGEREQQVDIFPFLDSLFKDGDTKQVYEDSRQVDETPDSLIRWIDDNIFKVYNADELAVAYDFIAQADKWLGRTRKTQEYKYWRYASANMTAGVAAARNGTKSGWTRYGPPKWRSPDKTKKEVARKIAEKSGASIQTAMHGIFPYLAVMTHHCKQRELTVQMAAYYDMNEKEVSTVTGSGENTNKVASIVEDAQELQEKGIEAGFTANIPETNTHSQQPTTNEQAKTEDNSKTNTDEDDSTSETSKSTDTEENTDDGQRGLDDFM